MLTQLYPQKTTVDPGQQPAEHSLWASLIGFKRILTEKTYGKSCSWTYYVRVIEEALELNKIKTKSSKNKE